MWQLAEKAKHKIIEPVRRIDHDVLKAVLDLRAMWAVPKEVAVRYFDGVLKAQLAEALPQVVDVVGEYWTSHHYALVRGKYSSVAEGVDRILRTLEAL